MKRIGKIISLLMAILITASCLTGCGSSGETDSSSGGSGSSENSGSSGNSNSTAGGDYEIYIYNSKGENAEQFSAMCEAYTQETGVKIKQFSIGSGQDHMETLRAEMASKNPPTIFSVQGIKELPEWVESGRVLDLSQASDPDFKKLAEKIPESLYLSTDGETNYGVPYNLEGYGYLVDKQLITDIFGEENTEDFLEDFKTATYAEFSALVTALDHYIKEEAPSDVTLSGNTYAMHPTRLNLAAKLEGVFSVAGSEKWTYGDHTINVAMGAVFDSAADAANADDDKLETLTEPFVKYAETLDLVTSHGIGNREPAFINSTTNGYDQSIQNFADSKAVFLQQGNWAYGSLESTNPDLARRLTFLPIKMPMTQADITVEDMTVEKFNSSIPVYVPNYYAINAQATEEQQLAAQKFLVWLNTSETGKNHITQEFNFIPYDADEDLSLENPLSQSILEYKSKGNILPAAYHGAPASWSSEVVGLYLMENYLTKADWSEEDYRDISAYAIDQWKQMKNAA